MNYISHRATIEEGVYIGKNVAIFGKCIIRRGAIIEDSCLIGKPSRVQLYRLRENISKLNRSVRDDYSYYDKVVDTETVVGEGAILQHGTTIYSGSVLSQNVFCEDNCIVRWDTVIGAHTKIMFAAQVSSYVTVGEYCRIGGFCCNDTKIGDYTSMYGQTTHSYTKYGGGRRDKAPVLGNRVSVGFGSQIIGDITIGDCSYLAAGSTVTKNIPSFSVVLKHNKIIPVSKWKGKLKKDYLDSF